MRPFSVTPPRQFIIPHPLNHIPPKPPTIPRLPMRFISMSTLKQTEANRQNAKHSTGPRTPEGKSKSSKNALKHGLTAVELVLPTESQEEFDEHAAELRDEHHPSTPTEHI